MSNENTYQYDRLPNLGPLSNKEESNTHPYWPELEDRRILVIEHKTGEENHDNTIYCWDRCIPCCVDSIHGFVNGKSCSVFQCFCSTVTALKDTPINLHANHSNTHTPNSDRTKERRNNDTNRTQIPDSTQEPNKDKWVDQIFLDKRTTSNHEGKNKEKSCPIWKHITKDEVR